MRGKKRDRKIVAKRKTIKIREKKSHEKMA